MQQPLVFDIKRYSINDGPGIRITVFFKGCPLNCLWCHNPESISPKVQRLFTAGKCIGCGECCRICPMQACSLTPEGVLTDAGLCELCGLCAQACPTLATEMSGRYHPVEELLGVIEKERPFFEQSGGGVTLSGGEPLLYPDYLVELLRSCGERHIHRAVDTSGHVGREALLRVAEHVDLFLYDLKTLDPETHKRYTGVDNTLILDNLVALAETGASIQLRIPLIGGVNDGAASIEAFAGFIASLPGGAKEVSLLPFHDVARGKDDKLGQRRDLSGLREPSADAVKQALALFASHDLQASVGG